MDELPDSENCVASLARTCQLVIGSSLTWPAWPDFDAIRTSFVNVPSPASYAEAISAVGLLVQFAQGLGERVHRRIHSGDGQPCSFVAPSCTSVCVLSPLSSVWNPGVAMQTWLSAYEDALLRAHCRDIAVRATRRLAQDERRILLRELARDLGCSVPVLQRRFLQDTGLTISAYRKRVRTAAAVELLVSSDQKVEAVARQLGWNSKKGLYDALRTLASVTPREVRHMPPAAAAGLAHRLRHMSRCSPQSG